MDKHTRFYIDISAEDTALLNRLVSHLSTKTGLSLVRADVMRLALRAFAKKEKVS